MVHMHLSHYGLKEIARSSTSIVLEGTLANCKRMAFAHGLEIVKANTRLISFDGSHAVYAGGEDYVSYELSPRGLIHKGRDAWTLVMPIEVWNAMD